MCAIAGILANRALPDGKSLVANMLSSMIHRGPDYTGQYEDRSRIFLGHNRLSIIDLSSQANQPMVSSCGRYVVVFNGEIYNYRELKQRLQGEYEFRSQSDSEVLLAGFIRWGREVLHQLIGMFAFAIYDTEERRLFAARDRFGVKPFYHAEHDGAFFFASEIKGLHASGVHKEANTRMWASYLTQGQYQWQDRTFWKKVRQLPAGHMLEVDANLSTRVSRWYDFEAAVRHNWDSTEYRSRTDQQHLDFFEGLLQQAVALRFRSDVPVGFNLSGGLDSSLLLGLVKATAGGESARAFSFYCGDERYDELSWVESMVRHTGTSLEKVLLSVDEVPRLFEAVSMAQDEPFGGIPTLAYSKVFESARELGTIVLLDGQGVDEAWAGYDYYRSGSNRIVQGVKSNPLKPEVLDPDFKKQAYPIDYPETFDSQLLNLQYRDLFHTKIPRALRFNDRVSMMHSTELREPFLDYRLVEYAFSLPVSLKLRSEQGKHGVRVLAERFLPSEIRLAPKRPLQTPQREWLKGELLDLVEDSATVLVSSEWFKSSAIKQQLEEFQSENPDNTFFIWQWISCAWGQRGSLA